LEEVVLSVLVGVVRLSNDVKWWSTS